MVSPLFSLLLQKMPFPKMTGSIKDPSTPDNSTHASEQGNSRALTLAICSNRPANLHQYFEGYIGILQPSDGLLIVLDAQENVAVRNLTAAFESIGASVLVNGKNLGLSASRNIAMDHCPTDYLIFIDDDVVLTKSVVESIRRELEGGAEIVGVRINGPIEGLKTPWYISDGQLHYLGIHNPSSVMHNTWGACMGLNRLFVKSTGIRFRDELGRKGRDLQCGDDTTFVRDLKEQGAREVFLNQVYAIHNIHTDRLSLTYMLRRAYWQGRSEVRRMDSLNGVRKEWGRFLDSDAGLSKRAFLASVYLISVALGILRESFETH